jgi:DNA end-binding protein Ku
MSARPYWRGYLKLSLVSCPIALHAACSSAERISFRQINRKTGNRLRQQLIDEVTREPVEGHDKARGYEIGRGQHLLIEDDELETIEIASTHTIEIDSFVPCAEIDQRFFDARYYVTPNDPVGQEAFAVIREAMRSKALVALGRVVLAKRERVIALEACDKGFLGTTLRYAYEVRDAKDYFAGIPELTPAPELLRLAAQIVESKVQRFEPSNFQDSYEEALMAHLKARQAGMAPQPKQGWAVPRRAINLVDALRRSLAEETPVASRRPVPARKRA